MRIPVVPALVLAPLLAACAPRPAVAPQPMGPSECGSYRGAALLVNGTLWTTESDEEMREWLSRIDSADVRSMEVLAPGPAASALFGNRGSRGAVMVTLRRGSPSERRFAVPPPPRPDRGYCHPFPRVRADSAQGTAGPGLVSIDGPRSTRGQPST